MAGKVSAAAVLAEKMVQRLRALRALVSDSYPVTLKRLAELTDPAAATKVILDAVNPQRKAFSQYALVARKDLLAPVALREDEPLLAASPLLLEFLLEATRTPGSHAASVAKLKGKVTSKLKDGFQKAVQRQIDEGTLPPTVAWVMMNRAKTLLLLKDLHAGGRTTLPAGPATIEPKVAAVGPLDFANAFTVAFEQLDRRVGGHNFVSLVELRRMLSMDREQFDRELRKLRLAGKYSLSAAEGRHGISPEEHDAGILEDGTLLLYVSRKS
jgi:hypothetical protein